MYLISGSGEPRNRDHDPRDNSTLAVTQLIQHFIRTAYVASCITTLSSGTAHNELVVYIFFLGNLFLTGLQFVWGFSIINFVRRTLNPEESKKPKSATK